MPTEQGNTTRNWTKKEGTWSQGRGAKEAATKLNSGNIKNKNRYRAKMIAQSQLTFCLHKQQFHMHDIVEYKSPVYILVIVHKIAPKSGTVQHFSSTIAGGIFLRRK